MIVHLYTRCWNDAPMLPFMFRHYDSVVQRYVVFDDGSTDESLKILAAHPKVDLRRMPDYSDPSSRIASGLALLENCWQESRGLADWVIVGDIDEHLYHRDLSGYLTGCKAEGVTIIPALGYQMISGEFPGGTALLCRTVTTGSVDPHFNKLNLFSPDGVVATNFEPGRHAAALEGRIVAPRVDELSLLHYKYLGFERTYARHQQYQTRQRPGDIARKWGLHYAWSREKLRDRWDHMAAQLVDIAVADFNPDEDHPRPRWWDKYRPPE
jgi:hypothetical protein